jgi:hypothetical protein
VVVQVVRVENEQPRGRGAAAACRPSEQDQPSENGALWTNRRHVAWRPKGSRWFRPIRNLKVPPGDEKKYPQGGTTSLLNSLRDAVVSGTSAETRGEDNIWTVAMVEAARLSDQEQRTVEIAEVYAGAAG